MLEMEQVNCRRSKCSRLYAIQRLIVVKAEEELRRYRDRLSSAREQLDELLRLRKVNRGSYCQLNSTYCNRPRRQDVNTHPMEVCFTAMQNGASQLCSQC